MLSPLWAAVLFKLHADIFLAGPSPQVQLCHSMFWQEQGCVLPNLMTAQIWYYSVWPNSWLRRGVTHLLSTQTVFTLQRLHSVHNLLRQCLLLQGLHCTVHSPFSSVFTQSCNPIFTQSHTFPVPSSHPPRREVSRSQRIEGKSVCMCTSQFTQQKIEGKSFTSLIDFCELYFS